MEKKIETTDSFDLTTLHKLFHFLKDIIQGGIRNE